MRSAGDAAVSPVVGVMLMLVVTIIIAAVVSAFAGDLNSSQSKTPQVSVTATSVIDGIQDTDKTDWEPTYPAGFTAKNGLLFEHKGGDSFVLSDIYIQLKSGDVKYDLDTYDEIQSTDGTCLPSSVKAYIEEIGSTDGLISTGDKFMLYADNCRIDDVPAYGYNNAAQISWKPEGAKGGKAAYLNTKLSYMLVDKVSNRVISSGEIVIH